MIIYNMVYPKKDCRGFPIGFSGMVDVLRRLPLSSVQLVSDFSYFDRSLNKGKFTSGIQFCCIDNFNQTSDIMRMAFPDNLIIHIFASSSFFAITQKSENDLYYTTDPFDMRGVFQKSIEHLISAIRAFAIIRHEQNFNPKWPSRYYYYSDDMKLIDVCSVKNQISSYLWRGVGVPLNTGDPVKAFVRECDIIEEFHYLGKRRYRHYFQAPLIWTVMSRSLVDEISKRYQSEKDPPNYARGDYCGLTYLHALPTLSPSLVTKCCDGKWHNTLKLFSPGNSNDFPSSKKIIELMRRCGVEIHSSMESDVIDVIYDKYEQIVCISDVPVEWIHYNGVPLCFSHDICRISSKFLGNALAHIAHGAIIDFSVGEDILKDTHVLMCSPNDPKMINGYRVQIEVLKSSGFDNCTIIYNKNMFMEYIRTRKPKIVIIDTHGGYDKEACESYLMMGDDKMNGNDVINGQICVPIIFMSACSAHPTSGIIRPIADAFFQNGSLAITASMVPIHIYQGIHFIVRFITNLGYASSHGVHPNWLSFMSHLIRTFFLQTVQSGLWKDGIESRAVDESDIARDQALSMLKTNRVGLYGRWLSQVKGGISPEHMFYVNLGRQDLIFFDKYFIRRDD